MKRPHPALQLTLLSVTLAGAFLPPATVTAGEMPSCSYTNEPAHGADEQACFEMEQVTIFGHARDVRSVTGGAALVSSEDLEQFASTDVVRAIRRVPGVSMQVEDGYGLRPNISIRGTATERSSRVTLMEDGVLIAPAPYTAPSAYYFPTFGRVHAVEVLKGPSAITQGPYTVGGAINMLSTPIPERTRGHLQAEVGSDSTWRVHGWYGGGGERARFLVETHQWQSDGYQRIDRSRADTGLDKQDYMAKLQLSSDSTGPVQHVFDLKLQTSEEQSRQSYLGLTDSDFSRHALRRYGASLHDEMDNRHQQVTVSWRIELPQGTEIVVTAYDNEFERAWYKTEGMDFDGSANAQEFNRTSWSGIIRAINTGTSLGGLGPDELQALLDGADTLPGSIQLRNNAREYYARGIQLTADHKLETSSSTHNLQGGLRLHKDEEDRLQRNDTWQQLDGKMLLNDFGLEGNAGNRIQDAEAWALFVQDHITWKDWTFTPGLRFESINLGRVDYDTSSADPASRDPENIRNTRTNEVDIWIPGLGVLHDYNDSLRLVAGVHKGFSTPGNRPGVDPEESVNYELGLRYQNHLLQLDVMGFFNDYENLVGVCTNSSGSECEPGDAFNGEGVHVPGLEVTLSAELGDPNGWSFPLQLAYTWMDATFQSSFDSDFFGEVRAGDPVPYIPEHQAWASLGINRGDFSGYLGLNHVDGVCTQANCGAFEKTESATLLDLAVHYRLNEQWKIYLVAENLADETYIAGREPYGARPNKPRSYSLGTRFEF